MFYIYEVKKVVWTYNTDKKEGKNPNFVKHVDYYDSQEKASDKMVSIFEEEASNYDTDRYDVYTCKVYNKKLMKNRTYLTEIRYVSRSPRGERVEYSIERIEVK